MKTHSLSARIYTARSGVLEEFHQFLSVHDHNLVCAHALERPLNMFTPCNVYRSKGCYASCVIPAIPVAGHVYDISVPDSCMYTCNSSCI